MEKCLSTLPFTDVSAPGELPVEASSRLNKQPLANRGDRIITRKVDLSINTSFSQEKLGDTAPSLRSKVANALGIDISELPRPIHELAHNYDDSGSIHSDSDGSRWPYGRTCLERKANSSGSASVYSSSSDASAWKSSGGNSIEARLTVAVTDVLGLDYNSLPLDESFTDLGGNFQKASELRAECMGAGLAVETRDIMNCKTIAELETHVAPFSLHKASQNGDLRAATGSLQTSPLEMPLNYSECQVSELCQPPSIPPKAPARYSVARPQPKPGLFRRHHIRVEQALYQHDEVSEASVLKPKAGPFEGQLVAFVTFVTCPREGPDDCEVVLQNAYYTSQLPTIRKAIESRVAPSLVPNVWVVLERMPLDNAGNVNRRKLQTWIQNANDKLYQEILSLDLAGGPRQPTSVIGRRLQKAVSRVLSVDHSRIDMNTSFVDLGGDEGAAIHLADKCKSRGILFSAEDAMQATSLAQLATLATSNRSNGRNPNEVTAATFELSPMQRLYFHTPMGGDCLRQGHVSGDYRFNQSMLFRLKRTISTEDMGAAIEAIVGRHPMLRCRFQPSGSSWYQYIEPDIPSSYHLTHCSAQTDAEIEMIIGASQRVIDVRTGPVFAACHFHTRDGFQMLYMVAHHLVIDLNSWHTIAEDLEGLLTNGCLISGPSLSFREWALRRRRRVQEMEFLLDVPAGNSGPWGIDTTSNTYGHTAMAGFTLSAEVTSALEASCCKWKTGPRDIFVAALVLSFAQTFRNRPVPVLWEQEDERIVSERGHNAPGTVGCFTSLRPTFIDPSPTDDILTVFHRVRNSRRATAEKGVLQFTKSMIDTPAAVSFLSSYYPFELILAYAGPTPNAQSQDTLLEKLPVPGRELASGMPDIGRDVERIATFEASISIDQGEAGFRIIYPEDLTEQKRIEGWIRAYEKILRHAPAEFQSESPSISLSSAPHMDIMDEEIRQLNMTILRGLHINVSNVETVRPATEIQQNILINQSLIPGSSRAQMIYGLETPDRPVDTSRICASWLKVSSSHRALRTVFCPSLSKNRLYDRIVLRYHSPSMLFLESDSVGDAVTSLDNVPPLLLNEGIPWHRLVVCRVGRKIFLKLEVSQAVCDVASMTILFKELEQAYFHNQISPATEASYSRYMRRLGMAAYSVDFWKKHLRGVQPCRFPALISECLVSGKWEMTSTDLEIPNEKLKVFAKRHKIDASAVLQVAWGLVLRAYTGRDGVCFGFRVSGRDLPVERLGGTVGSFSSILATRLEMASDGSITRLLLEAEKERSRVLDHQHVPITRVEHELKVKGGHLFNTYLSFGYEHVLDDCSGDSKFYHIRTKQSSEYDISMDVHFRNGDIIVDIGYRILNSEHATTITGAFGKAIEAILDAPTSMVKEVDLFSVRDYEKIMAWNSMPQTDVPKGPVHQIVANYACLNPYIQAICAWDGDLSYGDLHRSSLALAKYLLSCGLKPQMPVPVIVNKSRWTIVAMLAVLYAGAILVPVDAQIPSMFARVINATKADLVLISEEARKRVDGLTKRVIIVNENTILAMAARVVNMNPLWPTTYETACILFGSKSRMASKGISYSHGALATACSGQGSTLLINPSSRVMQLSSYSVDIALSEVFTTLVNGGCVCVPSASETIRGFSAAARRMHVNWTYLTPTLSRKLDPESLSDLAVVCFRVRPLDDDVYTPWIGKAKVLLAYGFAEACPLALSAIEVTRPEAPRCLGSPFCGNFWIVSPEDNNRLMPVGALGELLIGGPTLASGFDTHGPDVKACVGGNAARAKPSLEESGSRLLKTGQYVRYREDGGIDFASDGTQDAQINGRRFRLSTVETKLRQCLGQGVGVVVDIIAFNDPNSTPVLAAFIELGEILPGGNQGLPRLSRTAKERLYRYKKMATVVLQETLPSYMVPSAYIPVKRMPLTPALDISRLKLQRLIAGFSREQILGFSEISNPPEAHEAGLKPLRLTQVESGMRMLWAQILGTERDSIIVSAGFITLGGDAVLAHDLIVECRRRNIDVSIIDILRNLSLIEICKGITEMGDPPATFQKARILQPNALDRLVDERSIPPLEPNRSLVEDVAEASSLQTMFVESAMLRGRGNINYIEIIITGALNWCELESACYLLTEVHPTLRTTFMCHNRKLYQTVLRSYRPEFLRYQCQGWRLRHLAVKIVKRDRALPVDFSRPITKFSYIDAGKRSLLLIRLSRAQCVDTSLPALVRDLSDFYSRRSPSLKRPSFCEWLRAAQNSPSNGANEYWRVLLAGAEMTRIVSRSSPTTVNLKSATLRRRIPSGPLHSLGVPFEAILRGAWSVVLSNLSSTSDVVFGQLVDSPLDNQGPLDIVGPMGNISPVRTQLPDAPVTPYEYLQYIQSQHVISMRKSMQTSDIVRNCTPWPSWTRFSSIIYHRSQGDDDRLTGFSIGKASCKLKCVEPNHYDSDIFVESVMTGSTDLDVSLTFCEKNVPILFADGTLEMLCSVISLLAPGFVMEPITLKSLCNDQSIPRIPLPEPKQEPNALSSVRSVDPDLAWAVHTMISVAWDTILDAYSLRLPNMRSVPFYEIWGTLVPAAELARYFTENVPSTLGLEPTEFTMEEITNHPTMMQQYELIISKMKGPRIRRNRNPISVYTQSAWVKSVRKLPRVGSAPNPASVTLNASPPNYEHSSIDTSTSIETATVGGSQNGDGEVKEVESPSSPSTPETKTVMERNNMKTTETSIPRKMIPTISG